MLYNQNLAALGSRSTGAGGKTSQKVACILQECNSCDDQSNKIGEIAHKPSELNSPSDASDDLTTTTKKNRRNAMLIFPSLQ